MFILSIFIIPLLVHGYNDDQLVIEQTKNISIRAGDFYLIQWNTSNITTKD